MAQPVRHQQRHVLPVLDSDGRAHPVENGFAAATVLLGAVALVSALVFPGLHLLASWAGLVGLGAGLWGQMISATTAERFLLVAGLGASALGFYLGMAEGGLFGGLVG
ncbi:hypothetical protein V1J52_17690 [Streptomyces sp. TRM 70351]|uniref:hypothetical protein n=1 Tax=Streptomyces sp. TRM 70351 TaxID=3116552 RepID=UPI002E7C0A1F|nr:hypothetical protein [Streptomyces sp. TRM 70351]MEE1929995.1 hypothetical protein [Streptomyces sp. TRM 70351]